MPNFTPEQQAVIDHIVCAQSNLIVNAVAGSGKTTTIVAAAKDYIRSHRGHRVLLCAFNTRIKEALEEKLGGDPSLEIRTLNSLGHRALQKIVTSRLQPDNRRTTQNAKGIFEWGEQPDLSKLVGHLKMSGWVPFDCQHKPVRKICPDTNDVIDHLIDAYDLDIDVEKPDFYARLRLLMNKSIHIGLTEGLIDYDDQIYLSLLWGAPFEKFPYVLGDEMQDTNMLQRLMIRLCMAPGGHICGVGDRNQAIYAFRGAGFSSMEEFKEEFKCIELPLTFCFRCPQKIVRKAQQYVPQIRFPEGTVEGTLETLERIDLPSLQPKDVILCRNTKPLVALCYSLIRRRIPATILGREIGDGLISLIKKVRRKGENNLGEFDKRLDAWYRAQRTMLLEADKEGKAATLEDKVETILALIEGLQESWEGYEASAPTIDNLVQTIAQMFAPATDRLTLSTIHKAKGLEWERVFFLDPHLIPSKYARTAEAIQQENNCIYVATTRAQGSLFYIRSEDFFRPPKEQGNGSV